MNRLLLVPFFLASSSYAMEVEILPEKSEAQSKLFASVYCREGKLVADFIRDGVDPNDMVCKGFTYLQLAVTNGDYDAAKALIEHEADVNACGEDGFTALHDAILTESATIITMLLVYGANANAKIYDGTTVLHMAVQCDNQFAVELLLQDEVDKDKVAIDEANDDGQTPLFDAVMRGNNDIVTLLIEGGANVNISGSVIIARKKVSRSIKIQVSPLHIAVGCGASNIICQLLAAKANPNSIASNGLTPLDYAYRAKNKSIRELLIKCGAKTGKALVRLLNK